MFHGEKKGEIWSNGGWIDGGICYGWNSLFKQTKGNFTKQECMYNAIKNINDTYKLIYMNIYIFKRETRGCFHGSK